MPRDVLKRLVIWSLLPPAAYALAAGYGLRILGNLPAPVAQAILLAEIAVAFGLAAAVTALSVSILKERSRMLESLDGFLARKAAPFFLAVMFGIAGIAVLLPALMQLVGYVRDIPVDWGACAIGVGVWFVLHALDCYLSDKLLRLTPGTGQKIAVARMMQFYFLVQISGFRTSRASSFLLWYGIVVAALCAITVLLVWFAGRGSEADRAPA